MEPPAVRREEGGPAIDNQQQQQQQQQQQEEEGMEQAEARAPDAPLRATSARRNARPASSGAGAGGGVLRAASARPDTVTGTPVPITEEELEAEYLYAEGLELASRDAASRRGRGAAPRAIAPGVEFDGRSLRLTGGALRALASPSFAAVAEVVLSDVAFSPHILGALPALAALPRLSRLGLCHNRIATLPALDALLSLPRLRALDLASNPVCACALLRPYLAHRLPRLGSLDGAPLSEAERARGAALFRCIDAELARGLAGPGQRAALTAAGVVLPSPFQQLPPAASQQDPEHQRQGATHTAAAALRAELQGGQQEPRPAAAQELLAAALPHLARAAEADGRAAPAGRAFLSRWALDAGAVLSAAAQLDEAWPAFLEARGAEGWGGRFTLPRA
ncbi:hypothetical protein Rsub_05659 [Raphidocelis subcapitata]|uniref:Uncharacterized protein n=1 Tax=Raphidocelis subcapitata TaxID=307507 RepID=A0A2V0NZI4_9CHLO|nr:hypothetical protein Rsub_05659 [Raphidocelis subcapitata]|eukprot:GBF93048.1 hypothetical protein Rsub_05659 [Raphidocelis subcapitata]